MYFLIFFFLVLVTVGIVIAAANSHENMIKKQREDFIENYHFPDGLDQKIKKVYPSLLEEELHLVFRGLRDYFQICRMAEKRMVSMPSKVIDAAWHEFILFTGSYRIFCQEAFGRFLDHSPAEAMDSELQPLIGMKRTWKLACRRDGINPKAPVTLPLLFAIDDQLHIPDGLRYTQDEMKIKSDEGYYNPAIMSCSNGVSCSNYSCGGDSGSSSCGGSSCGSGCSGS